ncbi:MAG: nucleotidyltransferase domain-containing protein [Methylacidiphilales bacterium]|nr:nucleotidyltransferase domain-containing protein [Candidatus Methylacidiphilales bacterium]
MNSAIGRAKEHSNRKLDELRGALAGLVKESDIAITFGSYARREASTQSDIDYIVVGPEFLSEKEDQKYMEDISDKVASIVTVEPSVGGAFAKFVVRDDLLNNIGGERESNHSLTRRLLLLLEGDQLTNHVAFVELRRELIEKYVNDSGKDHQLALFLLNDIIRYWRTMAVDYLHKVTVDGKPWAIRNIKLIFSRKLMYASGLFSVGMTVDRRGDDKVKILEDLFNLSVIERLEKICGGARLKRVISSYGFFLDQLEKQSVRDGLKGIANGNHDDPVFRELKNEGHHFTRELMALFEETFHSTHPIRRAVIF